MPPRHIISQPMQPTVAAIILAGGYSRRMGQDKALLSLPAGQSLLGHTYQVATEVASHVVVVTPWPSRYRAALPSSAIFVQEPVIQEPATQEPSAAPNSAKPSDGPLHGFVHGWQHIAADWCLLLACDMPYLEATALKQWWHWLLTNQQLANKVEHSPVASLVTAERGWQPLCGFYHRSCLPSLQRYLTGKQRSFQPWLRTLPVLPYAELPPRLLFNCNTPGDWQHVCDGSSP